jgi:cysteine-rich repeat protein
MRTGFASTRRFIAAAVASILLSVPSPQAHAAVLEVPADHATIQAALNAAGPGDFIDVASGTYAEKVTFTNGGTLGGGYITLRAAPGAPTRPVLDGTGVPGANMILIDSKSYVRVEGFELVNNLNVNDGSGVRVIGAGSNIEIRDNVIHEMRGEHAMGITVYATEPTPISDLIIDGNEIYDCDPATSEALTLNGNVTDFEVTNNLVRDVNNIGIDFIGGETDIQPNPALVARNGLVRGNVVRRARSSYEDGFAAGIYVDGGRDIVIENNDVSECDLGIEVGAENAGLVTEGIIVRNNLIHRNDKVGLIFGGFKASVGRANDNVFRGNTLYKNNTFGRDAGGESEIWVQYAEDNVIDGNIIYAGDDNSFVSSFAGSANNTFDHNLYFSDAGEEAGDFSLNGAAYAGFSAWQAGSGQDGASVTGDPLLSDPDDGDFHINAASPAFDAGDPSYVAAPGETDLDGAPRVNGARVEIGADEASCGDGVPDPGEECDDNNQTSGDGCDANCTITACGNGILTPGTGEFCDDGNTAPGDCCNATCGFESAGSSCADESPCTQNDVCDGAGTCEGAPLADPTCAEPLSTKGARVGIRDSGGKKKLTFNWGKGATVAEAAFGTPTTTDVYTLCVYVDDGMDERVVVEASVPTGAAWQDLDSKGFRYRNKAAAPDGISQVQLRPGVKPKIKVKGGGPSLDVGALGFGPTAVVDVQLRNSGGACFGATYSAPFQRNEATELKDSSD